MAYQSRDDLFKESILPRLGPGETLKCVAFGEQPPHLLLDGLLNGKGLAGKMVAQSLTKEYWLALTDRRVMVCVVDGYFKVRSQVDYVLGQVGGKVNFSKGIFAVHIEIQHPATPFKARFIRTESGTNRANAIAISEALLRG